MPAARKKETKRATTVSFVQIEVAPFTTTPGSSYSALGLSTTGRVYRHDPKCNAWIPWSNNLLRYLTQYERRVEEAQAGESTG